MSSHCGIQDSEEADEMANLRVANEQTNNSISFREMNTIKSMYRTT
jgi:hypothetical protein